MANASVGSSVSSPTDLVSSLAYDPSSLSERALEEGRGIPNPDNWQGSWRDLTFSSKFSIRDLFPSPFTKWKAVDSFYKMSIRPGIQNKEQEENRNPWKDRRITIESAPCLGSRKLDPPLKWRVRNCATGRTLSNETSCTSRIKLVHLTFFSFPYHLTAGLINIIYRIGKCLIGFNFWASHYKKINYKERLKAWAFDILRIPLSLAAPFVFPIIAFIGIFFCHNGRNSYNAFEEIVYGGPLLVPCFQPTDSFSVSYHLMIIGGNFNHAFKTSYNQLEMHGLMSDLRNGTICALYKNKKGDHYNFENGEDISRLLKAYQIPIRSFMAILSYFRDEKGNFSEAKVSRFLEQTDEFLRQTDEFLNEEESINETNKILMSHKILKVYLPYLHFSIGNGSNLTRRLVEEEGVKAFLDEHFIELSDEIVAQYHHRRGRRVNEIDFIELSDEIVAQYHHRRGRRVNEIEGYEEEV